MIASGFERVAARIAAIDALIEPPRRPPEAASFARAVSLVPAPGGVAAIVAGQAARTGVDPSLALSVARTESAFCAGAVSQAGAQGVMQLMPQTAAEVGVRNPFDPVENAAGGARYLRRLLDEFGDVALAVAAYNAGPAAVKRFGGVPPYAQTRAYVDRVLASYRAYRDGALR